MRLIARQQSCIRLAALLFASQALSIHAQGRPTARLIFESKLPRACPGEAALRASVSARLGRPAWRSNATRTIEVLMRSTKKGGVAAEISLRDAAGRVLGHRFLEARGDECVELAAATALAISIAIDPLAPHGTPSPPPASAPASRPAALASSRPMSQPVEAPAPRGPKKTGGPKRSFSLAAALSAVVGLGATPGPAPGAQLLLEIRWPRISFGIDVHLDLASTSDTLAVGSLSVWVASASASVCARRKYLFGCALLSSAWLRGEGHGLIGAKTVNLPLFSAGARAGVELPLAARWFIRAHGELLVALGHVTLVDSVTRAEFWRSSPVVGSLGLGVGVSFL